MDPRTVIVTNNHRRLVLGDVLRTSLYQKHYYIVIDYVKGEYVLVVLNVMDDTRRISKRYIHGELWLLGNYDLTWELVT